MIKKAKTPDARTFRGFLFPPYQNYERKWMKYTPKNQIKVDGKMSEQGADTAGKRLATAAMIAAIGFAIGSACGGIAVLLKLFVQ